MNSFVKKTSLALLCMTAMGLLAGCGGAEKESTAQSDDVLNFVAVTSTAWDADVTLGSNTYKLDVVLKKDKKAMLTATCTAHKEATQGGQQGGDQGGFPGGDFGGGDFGGGEQQPGGDQQQPGGDQQQPGGEQTSEAGFPGGPQAAQEVESVAATTSADYSSYNFTVEGTWSLEEGYGYDIVLGGKTIHTNYVKLEARHEFYYTVSHDDASSSVKFQAKDSDFRKTLAKDWAPYHERNAEISFKAQAEGNNSSIDTAYFFLVKDGSCYYDKPQGSARSIDTTATWKKENGKYIVEGSGKTATVETSVAGAEHEGFRLAWDGKTFLNSKNGSWTEMTSADFDGRTKYAFVGQRQYQSGPPGSYATQNITMNCTDTNRFYAYADGQLIKTGDYTFASETFTITPDGEDPTTVAKVDGVYKYTLAWSYTEQRGPNVSTVNAECELVYTPAA